VVNLEQGGFTRPLTWSRPELRRFPMNNISTVSQKSMTGLMKQDLGSKPSGKGPVFNLEEQRKTDYHPQASLSLYSVDSPDIPYDIGLEEGEKYEELTLGRLERCYASPLEYDNRSVAATIILEEELAGGIREGCTQTWSAHIQTCDEEEGKVIANFFDPLYFYDNLSVLDAFKRVDHSVSMECEAYKRLASLEGSQIPKFVGLFLAALEIPCHATQRAPPSSRNVYVLVLEFVDGRTLDKVDAREFTPKERARIMDDIIELKARAIALGVYHLDYFPRNLILRAGRKHSEYAVVTFDFESIIFREPYDWDPSEASRSRRVAAWRSDPFTFHDYQSYVDAGWFREEER
jgi:hypothetical protein